MLNYSIAMRSNPIDKGAPKKAYATSQYSEVMNINQFAEHIASHGSVYKRSDVAAILTMAVDCLREMALYCWDERSGRDAPRKEHDHAMDEMRYFAMDLAGERSGGFAAISVVRKI